MQMPNMDGGEFLRRMAGMELERTPTPILLTGRVGDARAEDGEFPMACDIIEKPFRNEDLKNRIGIAIRARKAME